MEEIMKVVLLVVLCFFVVSLLRYLLAPADGEQEQEAVLPLPGSERPKEGGDATTFLQLQQRHARLQGEWEALHDRCRQLEHQVNGLQADQSAREIERERLQQENAAAVADFRSEFERRGRLEDSLRQAEARENGLQEQVTALRQEYQELKLAKEAVDSSVGRFEREKDELSSAQDAGDQRLREVARQIAEQEKHVTALEEEVQTLRAAKTDVLNSLNNERDGRTALARMIQEKDDLVQRLQQELETLRVEQATHRQHRDAANQKQREEELQQLQQLCDTLQSDAAEAERQLQIARDQCVTYEGQLADSNADQARLLAEVQELQAVRAEYHALRSSHNDVDERMRQLTSQRDTFAAQVEELQLSSAELDRIRVDRDAEIENLQQRLSELADSHDRALVTLHEEREHRGRIERSLRENEQELADLRAAALAAESMREEHALVQENLDTIEEQMRLLTTEHEQARQELAKSEQKVGDLLALVKGYKQTVEEVETDKRQLLAELEEQQLARASLEHSLQDRNDVIQRHERERHDLKELREQHDQAQRQLQDQLTEIQTLTREAETRRTRLAEEEQHVAELTATLDHQQQQMSGLRQEQAELKARFDGSQRRCQELDTALQHSAASIADLEQDAEALAALRHELATVQVALREAGARTAKLSSDREQAVAAKTAAQRQVRDMGDQLQQQELELTKLRQEKQEMVSLLERQRSRRAVLEAAIQKHADELVHLHDDDSALTGSSLQEVLVEGPGDDEQAGSDTSAGSVETPLHVGPSPAQSSELLSLNDFITQRDQRDIMPEGPIQHDTLLGLLYTMPPAERDDLQQISGVGEALEKKLNALGVYAFKQIMDWDDVAVAEISKLLAFKDRVVRENWREQARELFEQHYHAA